MSEDEHAKDVSEKENTGETGEDTISGAGQEEEEFESKSHNGTGNQVSSAVGEALSEKQQDNVTSDDDDSDTGDHVTDNPVKEQRLSRQEQMEKDLYNAVRDNDQEKLKELVERGANVDIVYEDYTRISTKFLIHICCEKGRLECVKILIDNGAYRNVRDAWGQSPLMYCMATQYPEIAELLLSRSTDIVDQQDKFGKTALHCAAESGCLESVEVLLKYDASVWKHTGEGITPMMSAVTHAEDCPDPGRMVRLLLDAGYDLEMKDFRCKRTALQMAVLAKNIPGVEVLIAAGADVNTMDSSWSTPLTNAINHFFRKLLGQETRAVDSDVMMLIVMLTQSKSDLNMTLVEYCNPLISCAIVDAGDLTQYFLENGAKADIQFDPSGATPLIIATSRNSINVVKVLVRWNCRLDLKGRIQKRRVEYVFDPFELAVFQGYLEIAKLLALAGCSLQKVKYLKDWLSVDCASDSDIEIPNALQEDPELLSWFWEVSNNPASLMRACVQSIRQALGHSVVSKVASLPIPAKIQNLVTLADIL